MQGCRLRVNYVDPDPDLLKIQMQRLPLIPSGCCPEVACRRPAGWSTLYFAIPIPVRCRRNGGREKERRGAPGGVTTWPEGVTTWPEVLE